MEHKAVIVYGAGISGRGAAQVLANRGEQVYLYNDADCALDDQLEQELLAGGGGLVCGGQNFAQLLAVADLMVLSPIH